MYSQFIKTLDTETYNIYLKSVCRFIQKPSFNLIYDKELIMIDFFPSDFILYVLAINDKEEILRVFSQSDFNFKRYGYVLKNLFHDCSNAKFLYKFFCILEERKPEQEYYCIFYDTIP